MYGKIFASMYDGTLASNWKALVTFQQMIVLADADGVVDITPDRLAARTGIPEAILKEGIEALEAPDEYSRTRSMDGRRIERLDAHRPWGWRIVNYAKYRNLASKEEKRARDRQRIAEKRRLSQGVATCRKVSRDVASVANVAHTDTDRDEDRDIPPKPPKGGFDPRKADLPFGDGFAEVWGQWCSHRSEMKKKLTKTSVGQQLKKLKNMGEPRAIAALQHSMANGWVGIFEPDRPKDLFEHPPPAKKKRSEVKFGEVTR